MQSELKKVVIEIAKDSATYLIADFTCYISLLIAPPLNTFPMSKLDLEKNMQKNKKQHISLVLDPQNYSSKTTKK